MVDEANNMLGHLPHVKRFLGNLTDVDQSVYSFSDFAVNLNGLLQSVNKCIAAEDYEGLKKLLDSDDFSNTKKSIENLAIGMVAFKHLPAEYKVESFEQFSKDLSNKVIMSVIDSSVKLAKAGVRDNEALAKAMELVEASIAQMASYKWSDREGHAKEFLETLKDLSKNTLVPYAQSIAMAYTITGQLLALIKGFDSLTSKLSQNITKKIQSAILAKAKELGFTQAEAERFI